MNVYPHSKLGTSLFNLTIRFSKFLFKHRWLYYLLLHTWGLLMTLIGYLVSIILLLCRQEPHKYHRTYYFKLFNAWGGIDLGFCFVRDKISIESLNEHEFGHSFQNCLFGPFFIFLVAIPSSIRYWYQTIRELFHKSNTFYDAIWFEDSASVIGHLFVKYKETKKGE